MLASGSTEGLRRKAPILDSPCITILCDSGHKYQSKLCNREWLETNDLDPDFPLEKAVG